MVLPVRALVGLAASAMILMMPPGVGADAGRAQTRSSVSPDESVLLKKRFLAAVHASTQFGGLEHIDSLIDALQAIEKDFVLQLYSRDLIDMVSNDMPHLGASYRPGSAVGIKKHQPIEKKRSGSGFDNQFIIDAIGYTGICLPSEADYNLQYLDFLEKQKWPDLPAGTEPLRYGLYARMYQRGCFEEKSFQGRTATLAETLLKKLNGRNLKAGEAATYLYLLAATKRLDKVPGGVLERFAKAQLETGSWDGGQTGEPAVAAAHGAYVLAALLKKSGMSISQMDIFNAQAGPPELPTPIPFGTTK